MGRVDCRAPYPSNRSQRISTSSKLCESDCFEDTVVSILGLRGLLYSWVGCDKQLNLACSTRAVAKGKLYIEDQSCYTQFSVPPLSSSNTRLRSFLTVCLTQAKSSDITKHIDERTVRLHFEQISLQISRCFVLKPRDVSFHIFNDDCLVWKGESENSDWPQKYRGWTIIHRETVYEKSSLKSETTHIFAIF